MTRSPPITAHLVRGPQQLCEVRGVGGAPAGGHHPVARPRQHPHQAQPDTAASTRHQDCLGHLVILVISSTVKTSFTSKASSCFHLIHDHYPTIHSHLQNHNLASLEIILEYFKINHTHYLTTALQITKCLLYLVSVEIVQPKIMWYGLELNWKKHPGERRRH